MDRGQTPAGLAVRLPTGGATAYRAFGSPLGTMVVQPYEPFPGSSASSRVHFGDCRNFNAASVDPSVTTIVTDEVSRPILQRLCLLLGDSLQFGHTATTSWLKPIEHSEGGSSGWPRHSRRRTVRTSSFCRCISLMTGRCRALFDVARELAAGSTEARWRSIQSAAGIRRTAARSARSGRWGGRAASSR